MARIKRGGRELVVDESELQAYLNEGYAMIDDKGNELTRAKAMTYEQAMNDYESLLAREKQLTASLSDANAQIAALAAENIVLQKRIDEFQASAGDNSGSEEGGSNDEPAKGKGKPKNT